MTSGDRDRQADALMLEEILEVTRQLAAPHDLRVMLARVIDAAKTTLRAERGSVFLHDPHTDELFTSVATGVGELRFPADRGIAGECAQTRAVINVPNCYADPRFNPQVDRDTGFKSNNLLTLPLVGYDGTLVGVLQLLNKIGGPFTEVDERIALALAAQCAVALQRVRMIEQLVLKERLDRELAVAREIQMGTLPQTMPKIAGWEVAGLSTPAEETGGDCFDLVSLPDGRLMILLGDATGHGVGPAISVTQVRAMLRMASRLAADLDATFREINDQLVEDLADNRFVTALLGLLEPAANRLSYHSAGQGPLFHYRAAEDEFVWYGATTLPMGFLAQTKSNPPAVVEFAPGDIFGALTDGVYEYEDLVGEQLGQSGVERLVRGAKSRPAQEIADALLAGTKEHGHGVAQADDITIVLVRRRA